MVKTGVYSRLLPKPFIFPFLTLPFWLIFTDPTQETAGARYSLFVRNVK